MLQKQSQYSPIPACFEQLESRQLMSAVVPALTGAAFTGVATSADASTSDITLTIASETKSGHVVGTLVVQDHGGDGEIDFIVKGSVNPQSCKFNLTCIAAGHVGAQADRHRHQQYADRQVCRDSAAQACRPRHVCQRAAKSGRYVVTINSTWASGSPPGALLFP